MNYEDYKAKFTAWAALTEQRLANCAMNFSPRTRKLQKLPATACWAAANGIRAVLALAACELSGTAPEKALDYACALEMLHCYSLIHDDMPCMDTMISAAAALAATSSLANPRPAGGGCFGHRRL